MNLLGKDELSDRDEFFEDYKTLITTHLLYTMFLIICMTALMYFTRFNFYPSRFVIMNIGVVAVALYRQYFMLKNDKYLVKRNKKVNNKAHNFAVISATVFTILIILNETLLLLWYLGYNSPYKLIF